MTGGNVVVLAAAATVVSGDNARPSSSRRLRQRLSRQQHWATAAPASGSRCPACGNNCYLGGGRRSSSDVVLTAATIIVRGRSVRRPLPQRDRQPLSGGMWRGALVTFLPCAAGDAPSLVLNIEGVQAEVAVVLACNTACHTKSGALAGFRGERWQGQVGSANNQRRQRCDALFPLVGEMSSDRGGETEGGAVCRS